MKNKRVRLLKRKLEMNRKETKNSISHLPNKRALVGMQVIGVSEIRKLMRHFFTDTKSKHPQKE